MQKVNKSAKIKNVIFDIGNVLLTWSPEYIVTSAFPDRLHDITLHERVFDSHIWKDMDIGKVDMKEAINLYQSYLGFSKCELKNLPNSIFESFLPIESGIKILNDLHNAGLHIYSITDCVKEVYDFLLHKYSFFEKFSDVVVSSHVGTVKPDLAIYKQLINRNNLLPEETVFIDDKLKNVEAARSLGMHAIQFLDASLCSKWLTCLLESQEV